MTALIDAKGIVTRWPTKAAERTLVLDLLAAKFEPGRVYTEPEVNDVLNQVHPDHAALRRYLVDDLFLAREDSRYWRSGGTVGV